MKNQQRIATIAATLLLAFGTNIIPAHAQQAVEHVSLTNVHNHQVISFTVSKETNVFHYTIEAGNDSLSFDIIGTIKPISNTMLARIYKYEVFSPFSKYYRVGTIGMNGRTAYTIIPLSGAWKAEQITLPQNKEITTGRSLAAQKK